MNNSAINMYSQTLDECVDMICELGHLLTIILEGDIGNGKSSSLGMVAERFPNHEPKYFDCTTKDMGDLMVPWFSQAETDQCVKFFLNEELGIHTGKPIILMLDELGKAPNAVKNALMRLMLERKIGSYELHPDSIVFATTNKGTEGVGDMFKNHQCNRISFVRVKKSSSMDWIEWGINNGIDHSLLGWVKDNPQVLASYEDVKDPDENPYIFHPKAQRRSFVTPRSLELASHWLKVRDKLPENSIIAGLMGTIGERAAMDVMSFVKLADQLPTRESIQNDPMNAKVPDSAAGVCMVVYRALATMERDSINPWMDYMARLDKEAQGLFANGVRSPKYSKRQVVFSNKKFTEWCTANNYMFAGDKQ